MPGIVNRRTRLFGLVTGLWVGGCHPSPAVDDPDGASPVPEATVVAVLQPDGPPPPVDTRSVVTLPPGVAGVWPEGVVSGYTTISVRFTEPMRQDAAGAHAPKFTFDPPLHGQMRWTSPYTVQFDPDDSLPLATGFTATLHGDLQTASGAPLRVDVTTQFETLRPSIEVSPLSRVGEGEARHWNTRFAISESTDRLPMPRRRFAKHIRAVARPIPGNGTGKGKAVPVPIVVRRGTTTEREDFWHVGENTLVVEPRDHWPPDREIEVIVDASLPVGALTLGRSVSATVVTEPGLQAEIKCEEQYADGCRAAPLRIEFSNPVARDQFRKIKVAPRPRGLKIDYAYGTDPLDWIEIDGKFALDSNVTVLLDADLRDVHGQPLHRAVTRTVDVVKPPPSVHLVDSHGTLPAKGRRTIGLETRWVERVQIRAAVLTDAQLLAQLSRKADELRIPEKPRHLHEEIVDLEIDPRMGWSSREIDLAAITSGERRPVVVEVKPLRVMASAKDRPAPATRRAIYQQTDLGALSLVSPAKAVSRVSSLGSNAPVAGVSADLYRATRTVAAPHLRSLGKTDAHGVVAVPRSTALPKRGLLLFHTKDDRFAARVGELHAKTLGYRGRGYGADSAYSDPETLRSTLITERPLYRQGDPVHAVGWSAWVTNRDHVGLRPPPENTEVHMTLVDRDGGVVSEARTKTNAGGKYWSTLHLPEYARLGPYRVEAKIGDEEFVRRVRVKDFRTPTFKLVASADRGDVTGGGDVMVSLAASYYYGGAVPIGELSRALECVQSEFVPPGYRDDWRIGRLTGEVDVDYSVRLRREVVAVPEAEAAKGRATLRVPTAHVPKVAPYLCALSVGVRDVSMMSVGGEVKWHTHPDAYLALRQPARELREGDRLAIPVRAVDFAGQRRAHDVRVEVQHLRWVKRRDGLGWEEREVSVRQCDLTTTEVGGDAVCVQPKLDRGHYVITAERRDGPRPRVVAKADTWVGPPSPPPLPPGPSDLRLTVSPAHPSPGDRVAVRITAPALSSGTGVLTQMHGGLRALQPFTLRSGTAEVELTADQSWVPQMEIEALVPRPAAQHAWERMASARTTVSIDDPLRALTVEVDAPDQARPNEEIEIAVQVRDAKGSPTAASVSVWAVDEAILSLAEPVIPDLVQRFIVRRPPRTSLEHEYGRIIAPYRKISDPYFTGRGGLGLGGGFGSGGGGGSAGGRGVGPRSPAVRERFETTPIFIGNLDLPATGRGTITGTLPENLTTFRVTAIASATLPDSDAVARFGHNEDRVRVTMPLVVRAVAPQVMRPGDTAMVAAVVDNLSGAAGTLRVALEDPGGSGVLRASGALHKTVPIAAGGQVRVPFEVAAASIGEAGIAVQAVLRPTDGTASLADAMKVPVVVKRERTLVRRSALYGSVDADTPIAVGLALPSDRVGGSGSIGVTLATSLLDGLQDVVQDLVQYPYGCVEQTSSGLVPLVALKALAKTYPLGVDDVETYVARGLARLQSMKTRQGGLSYWPDGRAPHVYGTAYALWVLEQAKDAGIAVPPGLREDVETFVREHIEQWAQREASSPHDDVRIAMAAHALARGSGVPSEALAKLVRQAETLPVFARALVLMALWETDADDPRISPLLQSLLGLVRVSGGTASVADDGAIFPQYFDSAPRTAAIVLLALVSVAPDEAVVEPLARGLMAMRAAGRLRNTQERAYALLALSAFADAREQDIPQLTADAWIGRRHAVSRRVEGERFASASAEDPMTAVDGDSAPKVTLRRQGRGRLYYRVGMTWTPQQAQLRRVASGLAVDTVLRRAEGVVGEGTALAPGTLLALDVTVTADAAANYVAVDIPLPAGLEAIDRSIGKGRRALVLKGTRGYWASHEEVRRDRALLFANRLTPGSHTHTVYLRATTPGTFEMPPTVAQSMYFPEISGHTARRTIVVGRLP